MITDAAATDPSADTVSLANDGADDVGSSATDALRGGLIRSESIYVRIFEDPRR